MDATGQGQVTKVVRIFDRAIAWSDGPKDGCTDVRAYAKTRDFESLRVKPGARPMVFHTRRLRRAETRDVMTHAAAEHRHESAFALGVTMIDLPDGGTMRPTRERWSDDDLDRLEFVDIEDVGAFVLQRSRLPLDFAGPFVAPPSSSAAMAALLYPYAAPSPAAAPSDNSKPEDR